MNSKSMDKRGSAVNLTEEDVSVSSPLKIHEKPIEDVIAEFQSHAENGISQAEAEKRLEEDGPNELEKPPRISLLMLFIIQLNSVIMYLLIGAVIASAAIKATGAERIFPTHGYTDIFARWLNASGWQAQVVPTEFGGAEDESDALIEPEAAS